MKKQETSFPPPQLLCFNIALEIHIYIYIYICMYISSHVQPVTPDLDLDWELKAFGPLFLHRGLDFCHEKLNLLKWRQSPSLPLTHTHTHKTTTTKNNTCDYYILCFFLSQALATTSQLKVRVQPVSTHLCWTTTEQKYKVGNNIHKQLKPQKIGQLSASEYMQSWSFPPPPPPPPPPTTYDKV